MQTSTDQYVHISKLSNTEYYRRRWKVAYVYVTEWNKPSSKTLKPFLVQFSIGYCYVLRLATTVMRKCANPVLRAIAFGASAILQGIRVYDFFIFIFNLQNLMASSLSKDTSLIKFSWRFDRYFYVKLFTDKRLTDNCLVKHYRPWRRYPLRHSGHGVRTNFRCSLCTFKLTHSYQICHEPTKIGRYHGSSAPSPCHHLSDVRDLRRVIGSSHRSRRTLWSPDYQRGQQDLYSFVRCA